MKIALYLFKECSINKKNAGRIFLIFKGMEANDVWKPANKVFLKFLLAKPVENSAVLFRSHFRSSLKKIFFGLSSDKSEILGYAYVDFTSIKTIRIIVRGDEPVFTRFLEIYGTDNDTTFQFIQEKDCKFFQEVYGIEPKLKLFFYDIHLQGKLKENSDDIAFNREKGYALKEFGQDLIPGIIKFYNFKIDEKNVEIFSTLDGIALVSKKKIVGAIYDNFSMLKERAMFSLIGGVKVLERERNKGICKFLLKNYMNKLYGKNLTNIGLFVDHDNIAAGKCYESVGLLKKEDYYHLEIKRA
ncbi:MAG: GNAT family N-acetyltransferase [Candidatus Hodarchaeota archaeon]